MAIFGEHIFVATLLNVLGHLTCPTTVFGQDIPLPLPLSPCPYPYPYPYPHPAPYSYPYPGGGLQLLQLCARGGGHRLQKICVHPVYFSRKGPPPPCPPALLTESSGSRTTHVWGNLPTAVCTPAQAVSLWVYVTTTP